MTEAPRSGGTPDLRCEKFHNAMGTPRVDDHFRDSGDFSRDDGATDVSRASPFGWFRPVVALSGAREVGNRGTPFLNWVV